MTANNKADKIRLYMNSPRKNNTCKMMTYVSIKFHLAAELPLKRPTVWSVYLAAGCLGRPVAKKKCSRWCGEWVEVKEKTNILAWVP
jgi:hypothetical protein